MLSKSTSAETCFAKKVFILDKLKSVKWMNKQASPNEQYQPAYIEHIANIITHAIWIFPSILGTTELCRRSENNTQLLSAFVYGLTLISLFCVSTSFHCVFYYQSQKTLKDILHRCDRGMIYIFIAGSYFPWLTIEQLPQEGWSSHMRWVIWIMALMGITYQQIFHEKYKKLEIICYLIMGICPVLPILSEMYHYKLRNLDNIKSPSNTINDIGGGKILAYRTVDDIGGGDILASKTLDNIERNIASRAIDGIGGGGILTARTIDDIGGGGILESRAIDGIGGGGVLTARTIDDIGGGGILASRAIDGIGGGEVLAYRTIDNIGGDTLGSRAIDGIGGGGILIARAVDNIGGGGILTSRAIDGIGGGGVLTARTIDNIGGGGVLTSRAIDGIGGGGILTARTVDNIGGGGVLASRALDRIGGATLIGRNVDHIGGGSLLLARAIDNIGGGGILTSKK
ncbi:uncharacterized protein [Euwallacea fornicatus]|uniref:uncharacterized protein n=1 Tax=Euwallacea fornicatus TaxID=995702 RepID=UPI00338DBD55